jgi:predicted ABC-type ATPase
LSNDPDKYRLSEADHERLFQQRVVPEVFGETTPQARPTAIFLGGQPGAGKSQTLAAAIDDLRTKGGAAMIAGDDLRPLHPAYGQLMQTDDKNMAFFTQGDAGRWVHKALDYAAQHKINVVFETTMRTPAEVAPLLQKFKDAGFRVEARVLAVAPHLSEQGILQRYADQVQKDGHGRMVPPAIHDAALTGLLGSVEKIQNNRLADSVTVYRRGNEEVRSFDLTGNIPPGSLRISAAIQSERERFPNQSERERFLQSAVQLDQHAKGTNQLTGDVKDRIAASLHTARQIEQAAPFIDGPDKPNAPTERRISKEEAARQIAALAPLAMQQAMARESATRFDARDHSPAQAQDHAAAKAMLTLLQSNTSANTMLRQLDQIKGDSVTVRHRPDDTPLNRMAAMAEAIIREYARERNAPDQARPDRSPDRSRDGIVQQTQRETAFADALAKAERRTIDPATAARPDQDRRPGQDRPAPNDDSPRAIPKDELRREIATIAPLAMKHALSDEVAKRPTAPSQTYEAAKAAVQWMQANGSPERLQRHLDQIKSDSVAVQATPNAPPVQRLAAIVVGIQRQQERERTAPDRAKLERAAEPARPKADRDNDRDR